MNRELPPPPPPVVPPPYPSSVPTNQSIYNAPAQSVLPSIDTVASHSGISVDYPALNYAFSQPATNQSIPPANSLSFAQPPQSTNSTSDRPSSVTTRSTDIANLFNSLVQAGIVPPPSVTNAVSSSAKNEESKDVQSHEEMKYEHNLLSINITLTSSDVAKYVAPRCFTGFIILTNDRSRTGIISYLYERMPVQCKQCAIRFPDGSVGKKRMEDHLDMHFRQNRKASENIGRGHSRSWFVGIKVWFLNTLFSVSNQHCRTGLVTLAVLLRGRGEQMPNCLQRPKQRKQNLEPHMSLCRLVTKLNQSSVLFARKH